MTDNHILLVAFPGQGHINPCIQFAKRLVRMGVKVTLSTSLSAINRIKSTPEGISFAAFSDGYDDAQKAFDDMENFMPSFKTLGSMAVEELIKVRSKEGHPFTHVVYATLVPWAGEVARRLHVPSTLLWIQPAAMLDIYYYYFNGYGDVIRNAKNDSSTCIQLPGLPLFSIDDLPSFFLPSNPNVYNFALPLFKDHIDILDQQENPRVLVNSFDGLEPESLKAIEKLNMKGVGPLVPSAFLGGKDPSDTSSGADLHQESEDYLDWLNSKPKSSVVYMAFGSLSELSEQQMKEIATGLLETKLPFLWVIRKTFKGEEPKIKFELQEDLGKQGIIVPWCSQVEVLSHPSVGCFVTHCGWNSSLESLVCGLPVVAVPQWTDQATNAKLIADVWKTGIRVVKDEKGIVKRDELQRCLNLVMGSSERGEEMRSNAKKWKDMACEAVKEGGSSGMNLKAFVHGTGLEMQNSI